MATRREPVNRVLMMVCLVILCVSTALCGLLQGQAATSGPKPEEQVAQLERAWLAADAKGDVAGLRRIIADDFIGASFDGPVLSKEDVIPQGGGPGGFAGATAGETSVRIFGDTAVLMGSIRTADPNQPKTIRVTLVCQKRPQGWQMIAAHLARMPAQE
jgi:ketosteroid isomerase-like protein